MSKKPKLVIIRGVRPAEGIFYDVFKRMEVKFIYLSQEPIAYPIKLANLEMVNLVLRPKYLFDPVAIFNQGRFNHRSLVKIEGLEDEIKEADVVGITDTYYSWCAQVAEACAKLKKKLVTVVWETIPGHPATFIPPYCWYMKQVVAKTDLFILRSRAARGFTDSIHIPKDKTKVIYKGVDLARFHPVKDKGRIIGKQVKMLYLGQLVESKGVDDLLAGFKILSNRYPEVKLVIAGDGPLRSQVVELANYYPIEYLGAVEYEEVPVIYQGAEIFCSPSKDLKYLGVKIWEELFSYTLMEALASGLPIVATNCGGVPEEVGKDNLLVRPGDRQGLVEALGKLIEDKKWRNWLGKANRSRAEELFDLEKQAKETETAILEIL